MSQPSRRGPGTGPHRELPPRWAEGLLAWWLPEGPRTQALLGDLEEEFAERVRRAKASDAPAADTPFADASAADRPNSPNPSTWYVREAMSVAARTFWGTKARRAMKTRRTYSQEGMMERMGTLLGRIQANLRFAVRRLLKRPLFTAVAIVSLALGIGANTAIFSLVNAVILEDPPYANADELIDIYIDQPGFSHSPVSYPDVLDLREQTGDAFVDVAAAQLTLAQTETDDGAVEMVLGEAVTGNYFTLLGVDPQMGRVFTDDDNVSEGAHPVVVLTHGFWQSRFAGDPQVVGQEMRLSGLPYTVIGVLPEVYRGSLRGIEPQIIVPAMMSNQLAGTTTSQLTGRGNLSFFAKARLLPHANMAQAETVVGRLEDGLREEFPQEWFEERNLVLTRTADVIVNPMLDRVIAPAAGMLMAVVGLVLLVACANLASFLLAQASERRKEIALRLTLGATRRELVGQLLTESVMLAVMGGVAGVGMALFTLRSIMGADLPIPLPVSIDVSLNQPVMLFSVGVSVVAGILFGLAPALQASNPALAATLRDESAGGGQGRGAVLRSMLVVGQVAMSLVLLVGAGLFLRSLAASSQVSAGFGDEPAAILDLVVPDANYPTEEEALVFMTQLEERVAQLPGVQAIGYTGNLHLNVLNTQQTGVQVAGIEPPPGREAHLVDYSSATEGFFDAAGIQVVEGRGITAGDLADTEQVVVVSEAFVAQFFPDGSPIGRIVTSAGEDRTVVGVAADTKVRMIGEDPRPFVYFPNPQRFSRFQTMVVRTTGNADRLATESFAALRSLDESVLVAKTISMERYLASQLLPRRMGAMVVGAMAGLAMVLACIGLYGVVSYAVARRAREVGIRMSLGAEPWSVVWMLTSGGMRLVFFGGVIGLALSAFLSQLLSRLLYGVPALDPVTFIGVPTALGIVAFLASWLPARRASRVNPVSMLRTD